MDTWRKRSNGKMSNFVLFAFRKLKGTLAQSLCSFGLKLSSFDFASRTSLVKATSELSSLRLSSTRPSLSATDGGALPSAAAAVQKSKLDSLVKRLEAAAAGAALASRGVGEVASGLSKIESDFFHDDNDGAASRGAVSMTEIFTA
jgi:hypothetical protein